MTAYRCTVLSAEGRTAWRTVEAPDEAGAVARLVSDGLTPLSVRSGALTLADRLDRPVAFGGGLRLSEQSLLLTQLALLVRAGLPVDRSLDLLREQAPRAVQRDLIAGVLGRVRAGGGLARGLEETGSFPGYVTGVVRAAERGGRLGDALATIAARLTESATTRRQLTTALTYPAAVLAATIAALALVLTTVVPQFEPVFAGEEDKLPTLTRLVLALSRTVDAHGLLLLVLGVAIPVGLWLLVRSAGGQAFVTRYRHRIPGLRLRDQYLSAQVTGILGTLLANGVPVVAALPLVRGAVGSRLWQAQLGTVERQVREGRSLSAAMSGTLMPSSAVRLIEVGERSGQLAGTCARASEILVQASRARIDRIVALANPIAIVTLGGLVAMLVAGVMLGIFALGDFAG